MNLKRYLTQPSTSSFAVKSETDTNGVKIISPLEEPLWKSVVIDTLIRLPKAIWQWCFELISRKKKEIAHVIYMK